MARLLRMPGIAANTHEAVLEQWSIPLDTAFAAGDVLATVETEKAVVDIEADAGGVLARLLARAGDTVAIGAPIAVIADVGEPAVDVEALLAEAGGVTSGASDGTGVAPAAGNGPSATADSAAPRQFASPLARRLARENGIPIDAITGTGPNDRVLRRDVEAALSRREPVAAPAPAPAPVTAHAPRPVAAPPVDASVPSTDIPHSQMRRTIAARLTESKQTVPHFYVRGVLRAGRLTGVQRALREQGTNVSLTDLIVKAAARALHLVPEMNVVWTPDAVRRFERVDVALAVAVEGGLVTPVIRDVDARTASAVAVDRQDLVERARARRLDPAELVGGTMTVSSLGMYGVTGFDAIINPPQSAILAVGAIHDAAVAEHGSVVVAPVMEVTLSVDHRPIDGVVAGEWMRAFTRLIEEPVLFLS